MALPPNLQPVYNHPTGIEPLAGAHLITGSPYTVKGWGDDVNFYERSEQSYASLQNSLQDYFDKFGIGVNTEDYFYNPTHMLAQPSNITDQEWDEISLGDFNVKATPRNKGGFKYGSFNVDPSRNGDNLLLTTDGLRKIANQHILDAGAKDNATKEEKKAAKDLRNNIVERSIYDGEFVDIHEYLHSIDTAGGGDRVMSDIMSDYLNESLSGKGLLDTKGSTPTQDVKWTEQALYERWMNDPDTEHLNQVSREGFGRFLAKALMDETYRKTHSGNNYRLSPHEIFARAGANTINPHTYDEGFTEGMFGNLEEGFANALASFLNN